MSEQSYPKYKATVTIYAGFDPAQVDLTRLAYEADQGDAICTDWEFGSVADADLPAEAASFFNVES